MSHVQLKNDFPKPLLIKKRVTFGKLMQFNENECYLTNADKDLILIVKNKKIIQALMFEMKKHIEHFQNDENPKFKNNKNELKLKYKNLQIKKNVMNHQILKLKL